MNAGKSGQATLSIAELIVCDFPVNCPSSDAQQARRCFAVRGRFFFAAGKDETVAAGGSVRSAGYKKHLSLEYPDNEF
jgi:hypothetical protein